MFGIAMLLLLSMGEIICFTFGGQVVFFDKFRGPSFELGNYVNLGS